MLDFAKIFQTGAAVGDTINSMIRGQQINKIEQGNLELQKEQYDYQTRLQREIFSREDNAIQRRVADLKAAGLSPTLAAGSAARAGEAIKLTTPQRGTTGKQIQAGALAGLASDLSTINKTIAETKLIESQKNKTDAETGNIQSQIEKRAVEIRKLKAESSQIEAMFDSIIHKAISDSNYSRYQAEIAEAQSKMTWQEWNFHYAFLEYLREEQKITSGIPKINPITQQYIALKASSALKELDAEAWSKIAEATGDAATSSTLRILGGLIRAIK